MYTKTIKTPLFVQLTFITFVLVMFSPFIIYVANASPLDSYCSRQFNQSFQYKISPLAQKKCETRFKSITDQWIS